MKTPNEKNIYEQLREALFAYLKKIPSFKWINGGEDLIFLEQSWVDDDWEDSGYPFELSGKKYKLFVKISINGQPRFARDSVDLLKTFQLAYKNAYGIFCAPFISEETARFCKEAGVNYLDLVGNCYIKLPGVFINIEGKKNPFSEKRELKSLFSLKASRIVRVLLAEPSKKWKTEELQIECDVSIGLVSKVLKKLVNQAWGYKGKGGFILLEPEMLLRSWAESYNLDKQQAYNYYTFDEYSIEGNLRDYCQKRQIPFALTLFSGAARVAPFVVGTRVFAYLQSDVSAVAQDLGLKPAVSGAVVTIINPMDEYTFYKIQTIDEMPVVSPIQLFIDLKNYPGRGDEAAEHLFNEDIKPKWEKKKSSQNQVIQKQM
jgi:hypothetical protein